MLRARLVAEVLVYRLWENMNQEQKTDAWLALHRALPKENRKQDLADYGAPHFWRRGARVDSYWLSWAVQS